MTNYPKGLSVGVVVVSYISEAVLPLCLIPLTGHGGVEVVVVDNFSEDASCEVAARYGAIVVALEANTGFATACNIGAQALDGRHNWIAFVNPDVVIDAASLRELAYRAPDDVVAVSPLLVDDDGSPHRDLARPDPSLAATASRYLLSGRIDYAARQAHRRLLQAGPGHHRTPVTSGACLLVRADAFAAVGGFPHAYFLNMEDVELCIRLRQQGGEVAVDTTVTALHRKGSSSLGVPNVVRVAECARAEALFFERCRPRWQAVGAAAAVFAGTAVRCVIACARPRGESWRTGSMTLGRLAVELATAAASSREPAGPGVPGPLLERSPHGRSLGGH